MKDKMKKGVFGIVTVGPAALWLFLFIVIPLIYIVIMSFLSMENKQLVFRFSVEAYKDLFSEIYLSVYLNSFVISLLNTVICILIGYPMAYIISKKCSPVRGKIYYLLLMIPFYTNLIVRLNNGWKVILDRKGILNELLLALGIIDEPVQFLYTTGAVVLGMVYALLPFMVLPLMSSIENLDDTLVEASYDLGYGKVKTFFKVILPLTQSGIFSGSIMVFIPTMAYYFVSDIMGGSKHKLIGNLIQNQFDSAYNWPLGATFALLLIIITLLLIAFYKKTGGEMDSFSI